MKRILYLLVALAVMNPATGFPSDQDLYLNAFGEAAIAYLNDSHLLLGTIADGFVADIIKKETAEEIAKSVQKRARIIRAKLEAVGRTPISEMDKRLIALLDKAYACVDHQAWTLLQYVEEKTPDAASRFAEQRASCEERVKQIAEFYAALPPAPELPEPLSTR
ncbi:MAG: hypothetical protein RDU20_16485 [Desulfomonilaceae bacterium]|nr:hypothetical protein [Desulfomonilaceae bacterium]